MKDQNRIIEKLAGDSEALEQFHQLIADENRLREVLSELNVGWIEKDIHHIITYAHPSFLRLTGYAEKQLQGKPFDIILDQLGSERLAEAIALRESGKSNSYELPVKHRLGHTVWFLMTGAPKRDEFGRVIGSVAMFTDISLRKSLEAEAEVAMKNEALARKRERKLMNKMSHEIRTPINAINGMFQLLDVRDWKPNELTMWQGAQRAAIQLRKVVDEALELSRLESGRMSLQLSPANVVEVTQGLYDMHDLLAKQKGLELECACRLLTKTREFDVDKWLQVLTNLMGNAIKFTSEGRVMLDIYEEDGNPDWIFAKVEDTGPGVPENMREHIFQPFGIHESSEGNGFGSSGLGLSIARELAQLMGGDLTLEDSEIGATFKLAMPAPVVKEVEPSVPSTTEELIDWQGMSLNILIAEDNELNVMYMRALLDRLKVQYTFVEDGIQTLDRMTKTNFDVILLDVDMPVMDGIETLERIRLMEAGEEKESIPVFMVSAFSDELTHKRARLAGATGYLNKPFSPAELRAILAQVEQKKIFDGSVEGFD